MSKELDLGAYLNGVVLDFSRPGKPTDNAFSEELNGKVRAECIGQNWFLSIEDARLKCKAYRHEYNHERPHSSIGNMTPAEFMKSFGATCHPMAYKRNNAHVRGPALGQVHRVRSGPAAGLCRSFDHVSCRKGEHRWHYDRRRNSAPKQSA
ncbi:integrase core domain-containing protein [Leisingera sp.]|uniref:integrase core domain-containing protein n=1 Tax=Leisingera sp. TaxID=1879318 RepID=UPI003A93EB1E